MKSILLEKNTKVKVVALVTAISMLLWMTGMYGWMNIARAASVDDFSVTLTDTEPSVTADHTIAWKTPGGLDAATETWTLTFQSDFDLITNSVAFGDMDLQEDAACDGTYENDFTLAATAGADQYGITVNDAANDNIVITAPSSGTAYIGVDSCVQLLIGTNASGGTNQIVNPTTTNSYTIDIAGGSGNTDTGQTRVYIIDDIEMTASVNTSFTFDIAGVASGQTGANGEANTNIATQNDGTDPEVAWGTLSAGTQYIARHDLTVTTNAQGGFTVTVWQDGNIRSANGSDIDLFQDGTDGAPQAWASPSNLITDENTWGHLGITSADSTLSGGDTFGATLYDALGTESAPLEVFYHDGPADGSTADEGATEIGYSLEITALQEAADDYANILTYVATPVF